LKIKADYKSIRFQLVIAQNQKGAMPFDFKKANRYLPHIILIGVGIGTANYIMNGGLNWAQWIIQALSTNLIIGYSLVTIASNKSWFNALIETKWQLIISLFFIFFFIGVIATEVELIIKTIIFNNEPFKPFAAGKMYVFNGVISVALGFSFFQNSHLFKNNNQDQAEKTQDASKKGIENPESVETISNVPINKSGNISLISTQDIVLFEAYDNYAFLYNSKGEKMLCDYSLLFLEKRLEKNFVRIHRKYIINTGFIKQFEPYVNGRYVIQFNIPQLPSITSSKSYSAVIRKLIKIH